MFFVRLGLKIISGDFEEDLTKIVGGVSFQRFFLIKQGITENLHNRKLAPLNVEFVLIQGIQWYLIFENRSNGSKVTVLTKVQIVCVCVCRERERERERERGCV